MIKLKELQKRLCHVPKCKLAFLNGNENLNNRLKLNDCGNCVTLKRLVYFKLP